MQFVRYLHGSSAQWGIEKNDRILNISSLKSNLTIQDLNNEGFRNKIDRAIRYNSLDQVQISTVKILSPVSSCSNITLVGLNYQDRVKEYDREVPENPILYGKAATAFNNPNDPIVYPSGINKLDYEVELAIVIGKTAKDLRSGDAEEFIAGYTVANDVTARDAIEADGSAFRGNSYDTFAPVGPRLVSPDEINPNNLDVSLTVNGDKKQQSNTSEFIFDPEDVVEYVSEIKTLHPGDVIFTGTPGGAGIYRDPPELLEVGDQVVAEIEGLGQLKNHVISE